MSPLEFFQRTYCLWVMKDAVNEEKEEVIVEATIGHIKNHPNAWFSIDELCVSLSISKRTFYQYFKTKNELVARVIHKLIHKWKFESEVSVKTATDIKTSFLTVYTYHLNEIISFHSDFLNNLRLRFPNEYVAMEEYFSEVRKQLLQILKDGQKAKLIKEGYNLEIFIEKEISFFEYLQKKHHIFLAKEDYIKLLNLSLEGLVQDSR